MPWILKVAAERLGSRVYAQSVKAVIHECFTRALLLESDGPQYHSFSPVDWPNQIRVYWHIYARIERLHWDRGPHWRHQPWVCTEREDHELNNALRLKLFEIAETLDEALCDLPLAAQRAAACLREGRSRAWLDQMR